MYGRMHVCENQLGLMGSVAGAGVEGLGSEAVCALAVQASARERHTPQPPGPTSCPALVPRLFFDLGRSVVEDRTKMTKGKIEVAGERKPTAKPPFTLADIRRAIPAHCWEKSLLRSSAYLAVDVAVCALLWYAATFIPSAPTAAQFVLWPLYWFWQVRGWILGAWGRAERN